MLGGDYIARSIRNVPLPVTSQSLKPHALAGVIVKLLLQPNNQAYLLTLTGRVKGMLGSGGGECCTF